MPPHIKACLGRGDLRWQEPSGSWGWDQRKIDAGLLLTGSCRWVCDYLKEFASKKLLLSGGHRHSFQVPVFLRRAKPATKPFGPFNRFCCEAVLRNSEMGTLRRSSVSFRYSPAK